MAQHTPINEMTDAELKTIAENRGGLFASAVVADARVELLSRGFREIHGQWALDATTQAILDLQAEMRQLRSEIPNSGLLSRSFLGRTFAITGYALLGQLLIGLVVAMMLAVVT